MHMKSYLYDKYITEGSVSHLLRIRCPQHLQSIANVRKLDKIIISSGTKHEIIDLLMFLIADC